MAGLSRGRGKSITVIIMTMEANSAATSAILKPSAAPAYQGSPWDQREAARAPRLRQRFTHIKYARRQTQTHTPTHTFKMRSYFVWRLPWTHTSAKKFIREHTHWNFVWYRCNGSLFSLAAPPWLAPPGSCRFFLVYLNLCVPLLLCFLCCCHLSFCVLSVFSYTSCLSVSWTFWMFRWLLSILYLFLGFHPAFGPWAHFSIY